MDAYVMIQTPVPAVSVDEQNHHHHQPVNRRSANFHPTIWGDYFLAYADSSNAKEKEKQEHERLKEEVRKMVVETRPSGNCSWLLKLELIDNIQRLGVAYHFEDEIEAFLRSIYEGYDHDQYDDHFKLQEDGNELHAVALRFRLLRQHGYNVPSDVFDKFKDPEGDFKVSNIQGLLSLYEAANYRVHDEDILEKALTFTTSQLEFMLPKLNNFLATQVNQALDLPIQKTLTRLAAKQFISIYQQDKSHDAVLLNFAKFDFNLLQKLHQKELSHITRWWKSLDCPKNSPFARDRVVEGYLWILGIYFEPKYSFARTSLTKVLALSSIMDDIYDVHGTFDELLILTDAIERWDINVLDELPSYMRPWYKSLLDVYSEMVAGSLFRTTAGNPNPMVHYAISSMQTLARAYFEEAKWAQSGQLPRFEEYVKVALVTCGYQMLTTNSLVGMGDIVTQDALDWVETNPKILQAASLICRLMDDVIGHEAEKERGELASAVECYMEQYGVPREEAIMEFKKQITNAWKDINQEWLLLLGPTAPLVPKFVLELIVNFGSMVNLLYRKEDGYTNSHTLAKHLITMVLVDPIKI